MVGSGKGQIVAPNGIYVQGGISWSSSYAKPTNNGHPPATNDPYASLALPTASGSVQSAVFSDGKTHTINPGVYSSINVSGRNTSLTLSGGTYIILGGGFTVSGGASVSGAGVTIFNASSLYDYVHGTTVLGGNYGGISISGNGSASLTAPTSGQYSGILFFQPGDNSRAIAFSGNAVGSMTGVIYAPKALVSVSGNGNLTNASFVVNQLSLSGGGSSSETVDGGNTESSTAGQLLGGDLLVYVDNSKGDLTSDELARIQDAINSLDTLLAPFSVTISQVSDSSDANLKLDISSTSAGGSYADGLLGCFDLSSSEITIIKGWNWYAGSDATQISAGQYDFESTVMHELGHALGLGHNANVNSVMHGDLAAGVTKRTMTVGDLAIPDSDGGPDGLHAARTSFAEETTGQWLTAAFNYSTANGNGTHQILFAPMPATSFPNNGFGNPLASLVPSSGVGQNPGNGSRQSPLTNGSSQNPLSALLGDDSGDALSWLYSQPKGKKSLTLK